MESERLPLPHRRKSTRADLHGCIAGLQSAGLLSCLRVHGVASGIRTHVFGITDRGTRLLYDSHGFRLLGAEPRFTDRQSVFLPINQAHFQPTVVLSDITWALSGFLFVFVAQVQWIKRQNKANQPTAEPAQSIGYAPKIA